MSGQSVTIPDDQAFASFKAECLCEEGWNMTYNKGVVTVWAQSLEEGKSIHKIKVRQFNHTGMNRTFCALLLGIRYWWGIMVWMWSCGNSTKTEGKGSDRKPCCIIQLAGKCSHLNSHMI